MCRVWVCLLLTFFARNAAGDPNAILQRARQAVAVQLTHQANYTCVQTIQRDYLVSRERVLRGCGYRPKTPETKPWMKDRLRLDVAVSKGEEIYSWHGAAKFTSSDVSQVVKSGPISSGSFVGFLSNIFVSKGTRFAYTGETQQNGSIVETFNYVVPLAYSSYRVQGRNSRALVPFHGSFSVRAPDYRLASLKVTADDIPEDTDICSAEINVTYQSVGISGHPSLIPATFLLNIDTGSHLYTFSRNDYSQCREFKGESTLRFEFADSSERPAEQQRVTEKWLPAGMHLHVRFDSPVDDRTSYAGDPIEGVLVKPLQVPGTETILPKGALLQGVITKLENHYLPEKYQLLGVTFSRLSYGGHSFLLNAHPETSNRDARELGSMNGWPLPTLTGKNDNAGVFVRFGSHLRLGPNFAAEWLTATPPIADASSPSLQ